MTRPRYETPKDLKNEKEVIEIIRHQMFPNVKGLKKLQDRDNLEFELWANGAIKPEAVVEIKCRNKFYNNMIYEKVKHFKAEEYEKNNIPAYIAWAVKTNNNWNVKIWRWVEGQAFFAFGGRTDRNDPLDQGEVVHVPIKYMKELK